MTSVKQIAANLLEYCKQDTWAMVVVARHLCRGATPDPSTEA